MKSDTEIVTQRFAAYETALMADDVDLLAGFFWDDATRYGTDGNQASGAEIDAARRRPHRPLDRTIHRTLIRTLAEGAVVAETEFTRAVGGEGRQSQVWTRRGDEWRVLHAHVSMLPG